MCLARFFISFQYPVGCPLVLVRALYHLCPLLCDPLSSMSPVCPKSVPLFIVFLLLPSPCILCLFYLSDGKPFTPRSISQVAVYCNTLAIIVYTYTVSQSIDRPQQDWSKVGFDASCLMNQLSAIMCPSREHDATNNVQLFSVCRDRRIITANDTFGAIQHRQRPCVAR